jgi:NAD(P)-dependent dehydrogenase (short-subunit alcohol dehydrogenase family)
VDLPRDLKVLTADQPELLGWTLPGLDRRSIVVTGAGSGIGAATARALAAAGARVLGVDRDEAGLRETRRSSPSVSTFVADLLDAEAPQQIVVAALETFGELTTVVNIAGVSQWCGVPEVTREHLEFHVAINVYAPFFLTQAALPHLLEAGGQVVFCGSSTSAYRGAAGAVGYDLSKHAVLGMMRALAAEFAPQGVRVNRLSDQRRAVRQGRMAGANAGQDSRRPDRGAARARRRGGLSHLGSRETCARPRHRDRRRAAGQLTTAFGYIGGECG